MNFKITNKRKLFIAKPTSAISANFKNCSVAGCILSSKVQYRFHKKLFITANENPIALAPYLLIPNFSLQSQVTKKSTTTPDKPTTPNFKNFILNITVANTLK